MKVRLFLIAVVLIAVALFALIVGYFFWSLKDKDLKAIPKDTDVLILIDVKKTKEQYFLTLMENPSQWFKKSDKNVSLSKTGIIVPAYIQIFHLKETGFSQWYSIFDISDKDQFRNYLKQKGFKLLQGNVYKKEEISVRIDGQQCVIGFSNSEFERRSALILSSKTKGFYADQLINNSVASVSYLAKSKIHKFAVYLNDDNIEIKTKSVQDVFSSQISDLEKQTQFLKLKLDSKNAKIVSKLFNEKLLDSIDINSISAISELESVNDKIVSYAYDDHFNEVEKVSYQKLVQPNYKINIQSPETEKLWSYFQSKKWINADNQFTAIPFQPNVIKNNSFEISIQSTRKNIDFGESPSGSFVFLKNNLLFVELLKVVSSSDKRKISKVDYVFYGNKGNYYYLKMQFKKDKLPIILR